MSSANSLLTQVNDACDRLERALGRLERLSAEQVAVPELIALRLRVESIPKRWLLGSDGQTPLQSRP
jgi:hypothetical protein